MWSQRKSKQYYMVNNVMMMLRETCQPEQWLILHRPPDRCLRVAVPTPGTAGDGGHEDEGDGHHGVVGHQVLVLNNKIF